jgi:hypothetical protein
MMSEYTFRQVLLALGYGYDDDGKKWRNNL